ncbi:hypothetical protein M8J76_015384 [Diaphorina citri]|nr:hypothetical protein M8J76_015384 [Diaphorina citri]
MFHPCVRSSINSRLSTQTHYLFKKLSTAPNVDPLPSTSNTESKDTSQEPEVPNPLRYHDYFQVRNLVKVKDMFDAKVHLGHKIGSLDERMKPYIYGVRQGQIIFDLDQSAELLRDALNFVAHIAYRDGIVLFVGQSAQNSLLIEKTAQDCQEFAHTRFWRQGMFTNSEKLFKAVTRLPDLVILTNTLTTVLEPNPAIGEAAKMCIPTVGIVDSNCNPNLITYPVPGNDDTPSAIQYYCQVFKTAILKGKKAKQDTLKILSEKQEVQHN